MAHSSSPSARSAVLAFGYTGVMGISKTVIPDGWLAHITTVSVPTSIARIWLEPFGLIEVKIKTDVLLGKIETYLFTSRRSVQ